MRYTLFPYVRIIITHGKGPGYEANWLPCMIQLKHGGPGDEASSLL